MATNRTQITEYTINYRLRVHLQRLCPFGVRRLRSERHIQKSLQMPVNTALVDVSDIFYFFCLGRGEGESKAPGGGWGRSIFIENPRRGVSKRGPRGREGVCGELEIWGGGPKYFFPRPKCPPSSIKQKIEIETFLWPAFAKMLFLV